MSMLAAGRKDDPDVEVTRQDQEQINEFGRLNTHLHEIRDDKTAVKAQLEKLDDAVTELMVGTGGSVKLLLGDTFVEVAEEYATEYCEKKQEELQSTVEKLEEEEAGILERQKELKKSLYARFGSSINLEE